MNYRSDLGLSVEPILIDKRPSGGLCVVLSHWRNVYLDGAIVKPRFTRTERNDSGGNNKKRGSCRYPRSCYPKLS